MTKTDLKQTDIDLFSVILYIHIKCYSYKYFLNESHAKSMPSQTFRQGKMEIYTQLCEFTKLSLQEKRCLHA